MRLFFFRASKFPWLGIRRDLRSFSVCNVVTMSTGEKKPFFPSYVRTWPWVGDTAHEIRGRATGSEKQKFTLLDSHQMVMQNISLAKKKCLLGGCQTICSLFLTICAFPFPRRGNNLLKGDSSLLFHFQVSSFFPRFWNCFGKPPVIIMTTWPDRKQKVLFPFFGFFNYLSTPTLFFPLTLHLQRGFSMEKILKEIAVFCAIVPFFKVKNPPGIFTAPTNATATEAAAKAKKKKKSH